MRINSFEKLVEVLTILDANLPTFQTEVGATANDISEIKDQLANLVYIFDYSDVFDTNKKAVTQIKQALYNGEPGETINAFPPVVNGAFPKSPLAGNLALTNEKIRRFKAAPGYTFQIGVTLGIEDVTPNVVDPATVKPTLQAFSAATDYVVSIVTANRGNSDQWTVSLLRKGSANWENVGSFTGKSADITITPTVPGDAEQIQIRIQLKKSNANYGQPSDPTYVTINP